MMMKLQLKTRHKILIGGGVLIGLILVFGLTGMVYLQSLLGLVDQGEVPGNPSLQESDLVDPDQTVLAAGNSMSQNSEAVSVDNPASNSGEASPTRSETEKLLAIRSDPNVYNILLIGTDNRGDEVNGRSDAMIIFSINKRTKKIHLVSLMRGLYVNIPGRGFSMLNNAFSYGGSKLLRQTIEENLRIKISDYILVNFGGFTKAVDQVGGIDIQLAQAEADLLNSEFQTVFSAGAVHLDGAQSLSYARIRYLDSDYKRTGRQRRVIECLLTRMSSLSVGEMDALLRQLLPLVKTNLSTSRMISLGLDWYTKSNYPVSQMMLPIDGTFRTIVVRNMQMVQFDFNDNIAELHEFLFDK